MRREAADKVYAEGVRGALEHFCESDEALGRKTRADVGYRGQRDALVHYRNSVGALERLAYRYEILRRAGNLIVDFLLEPLGVVGYAVEERNTHRYRAYIEVLLAYHFYGFKYVVGIKHL